MANLSSEDETDTLPERPTRIQLYQFEPVRQDFERVPEHCVSFDMRYSMGFAKSHSLKCSLHKWVFELYKLNPLSPHCRSIAWEFVHCYTWGLLRIVTVRGNTVGRHNFFVDHTHTQFTEKSNMATALTPQTDVTSGEAYRK